MKYPWLVLSAIGGLVAAPMATQAEVQKSMAGQCTKGVDFCVAFWPNLTVPAGWVRDDATSRESNLDFLVPKGAGKNDNSVFIYGSAVPAKDLAATLDGFIAANQADFRQKAPDVTIAPAAALATADGQPAPVFSFDPKGQGRFETVAYAEETDAAGNRYYLIFALSAETQALRDANAAPFRAIVAGYQKQGDPQ